MDHIAAIILAGADDEETWPSKSDIKWGLHHMRKGHNERKICLLDEGKDWKSSALLVQTPSPIL